MALQSFRGDELAFAMVNELDLSKIIRLYHVVKSLLDDIPSSVPACTRILINSLCNGLGYAIGFGEIDFVIASGITRQDAWKAKKQAMLARMRRRCMPACARRATQMKSI